MHEDQLGIYTYWRCRGRCGPGAVWFGGREQGAEILLMVKALCQLV